MVDADSRFGAESRGPPEDGFGPAARQQRAQELRDSLRIQGYGYGRYGADFDADFEDQQREDQEGESMRRAEAPTVPRNVKCGPSRPVPAIPDRLAALDETLRLFHRQQRECLRLSEQLLAERAEAFARPRARYLRSESPFASRFLGPLFAEGYAANASGDAAWSFPLLYSDGKRRVLPTATVNAGDMRGSVDQDRRIPALYIEM